jgi:hypothetical protein
MNQANYDWLIGSLRSETSLTVSCSDPRDHHLAELSFFFTHKLHLNQQLALIEHTDAYGNYYATRCS